MSRRQNDSPQSDPLACFITWTTYGTWLPGDERGWNDYGHGAQPADEELEFRAALRMTETECQLDVAERALVEETIRRHCVFRNWELHACNCRSNHVHVVVSTPEHPKIVMEQLKAWCTRRLKEHDHAHPGQREKRNRTKWWTERGSQRWLNDEVSLEAAIEYVLNGQ